MSLASYRRRITYDGGPPRFLMETIRGLSGPLPARLSIIGAFARGLTLVVLEDGLGCWTG